MKNLLLLLCIPVQVFCQSQNPDIVIKSVSGDCNKSCDCVKISEHIIKNKQINQLAAIYTYNKVLSGSCKVENQNLLFADGEFKEYIIQLFSDSLTIQYATVEEHLLWIDTKIELLHMIKNRQLKYQIVDELLKNNNSIGLASIWNSVDIKRLKYWDTYLKNERNYDELAEIAVIYHNLKLLSKRDAVLNKLAGFKEHVHDLEKLKKLMHKYKFIKLEDFKEAIYGGY